MACSTDFLEDDLFPQDILSDPIDDFLKIYLDRIKNIAPESHAEKQITLVTRAPDSQVAQVILLRANEIRELGLRLKVVFAHLSPSECLDRWVDRVCIGDPVQIKNSLRRVQKPQLLNAHEQMVLGTSMCWSGDTMNRVRENRMVTHIFETDAPGAARLAIRAFKTMWDSASPVSGSQLKRLSISGNTTNFQPPVQDHVLENWASNFHHVISTRH